MDLLSSCGEACNFTTEREWELPRWAPGFYLHPHRVNKEQEAHRSELPLVTYHLLGAVLLIRLFHLETCIPTSLPCWDTGGLSDADWEFWTPMLASFQLGTRERLAGEGGARTRLPALLCLSQLLGISWAFCKAPALNGHPCFHNPLLGTLAVVLALTGQCQPLSAGSTGSSSSRS